MSAQKTKKRFTKKLSTILVVLVLLAFGSVALYHHQHSNVAGGSKSSSSNTTNKSGNTEFDKQQYSTTNSSSIWVVVNKQHALVPKTFAPDDLVIPNVPLRVPGNESMQLRSETASALEGMFAAAKAESLDLMLSSGYRSYGYQVGLYNGYVRSLGQSGADKTSARPGHSEHQAGLAADIEPASRNCELMTCFADTPEGIWLAANSYKYGFILRYQPDKVAITGYDYEPWHFRFVGKELAAEMHSKNIKTLEEFFGISGGQNY
jgi:zinc D-Ala-D-Ala carboxypeptidase